jgi:hypothetical protein
MNSNLFTHFQNGPKDGMENGATHDKKYYSDKGGTKK